MKNSPPAHLVFAGGVTGGHVFPAIALAQRLRERASIRLTFLGSERPREREWLRAARIEHVPVPSAPLSPWSARLFFAAAKNVRGYAAALRFLKRERVDMVVGLGGFASAPTARAALSAGIPLVLVEANAVPGRVTRWLAKRAVCVCTAFESARRLLPESAAAVDTGLPIRSIPSDRCLGTDRGIVVLGGSGGAAGIDEIAPKAMFQVRELLRGWRIVHQCGADRAVETRRVYARLGLEAEVRPFFEDMPRLLVESSLGISRAGGSVLAELAAASLPSVLIPFPQAAGNHQTRNAEEFSRATGCPVVEEAKAAPRADARLAEELRSLLIDPKKRRMIRHLMSRAARPDAANTVAEIVFGRGPQFTSAGTRGADSSCLKPGV